MKKPKYTAGSKAFLILLFLAGVLVISLLAIQISGAL
jgi:hypothetical protein